MHAHTNVTLKETMHAFILFIWAYHMLIAIVKLLTISTAALIPPINVDKCKLASVNVSGYIQRKIA